MGPTTEWRAVLGMISGFPNPILRFFRSWGSSMSAKQWSFDPDCWENELDIAGFIIVESLCEPFRFPYFPYDVITAP